VFENTDFGTSEAQAAKSICQDRGVQVLSYDSYEAGAQDFGPLLASIKSKEPQVLFAVSYIADAILLTRQARELELDLEAFVGGGAGFTMPQYVESLGDDAEGVFTVSQWSSSVNWPGAGEFSDKHESKYGYRPEYHAAETYASTYVIADAIERAASLDKEKIRQALRETNLNTIFGPVQFRNVENEHGDYVQQNEHQMLMLQVQEGQLVIVWPEDLAETSPLSPGAK